jgi:hypothetical protein
MRIRGRRTRALVVFGAATLAVGVTAATTSGFGLGGSPAHRSAHNAEPSSLYWALQGDSDASSLGASFSTVFEGNTDQVFENYIHQANLLHQTGHPWTNVGPYGGVVDVPGVGSGNEQFGPVDGIGTAIAVDLSDKTGNTAYLGTIGGLYKTTDGGKTVFDIAGNQLARDSIGAIAVDPTDPSTVYAGTGVSIFTLSDDAVGDGVYVSHDAGRTWQRPSLNTHGYGVNAIAVTKNGTVYAGTTYGLWRSTDHGAHFLPVTLPDNASHTAQAAAPLGSWVTAIVASPTNPNEVTAAVGYAFGRKVYPDKEVIAPGNGLYRTTDNGTFKYLASSSQLSWQGDSSDPIGRTSLAYSTAPGGTGILWALVSDAGKTAGNHPCVDTPALPVCADGNTELNGIYRSGDDGATWQLEANRETLSAAEGGTTSAAGNAISYAPGVQSSYNNWILADPVDPNRVYIGLEEAFTGEFHPTGGLPVPTTNWATVEKYANACGFLLYFNTIPNSNGMACPSQLPGGYGGGTTHPDQHSAAFAATKNGFRLYSGNDGGWWAQDLHTVNDLTSPSYQGVENGAWSSLGQPPTVLPWDVTRLQDGSYLLALQDNGVAHVKPNGTAYQVCGGDGVYVFPGPNAQSYYCGIDGQTILGTTDDMKTTINVTPPSLSGNTFLSPWTVDATNPNHLLAAAGTVNETTGGMNSNTYDPTEEEVVSSTWQTVFTPPASPSGTAWDSSAVYSQGPVNYVAFCAPCRPSLASGTAATPNVVTDQIATNVKPGCKAVEAASNCWHMAASQGLPHEQVSGIAVDPKNPNTIYVSLRQLIVMGADPTQTGPQKVMVSHDGGNTFQDLTGDLPTADAHRIALRDGQLYVATDVGIFTAAAGSTHWSRFDAGLPAVTYRSMQLDPTGRYLVAGAYGRGGWVYDFNPPKPRHPTAHPPNSVITGKKPVAKPATHTGSATAAVRGGTESPPSLTGQTASAHSGAALRDVSEVAAAALLLVVILIAGSRVMSLAATRRRR